MDAQGSLRVEGGGSVSLINVIDVASRLKVESCPRVSTPKPAAADYYMALRRAFLTYRLPLRLTLDHDTVFFDNTTSSPFPTRLHLWLLAEDRVYQYLAQGCWFRTNKIMAPFIWERMNTASGTAIAGKRWRLPSILSISPLSVSQKVRWHL
jgi:hypothetical protein